ncbi:MAG: hypothetical protein LBT09_01030 [Planctomycetaceae bacterium]|nr:hypothetical protein [Planctomycetaceae bacterium]
MSPVAQFPMSPPPQNETLAEFTKRYCEACLADDIREFDRYMAEKNGKPQRKIQTAAKMNKKSKTQ